MSPQRERLRSWINLATAVLLVGTYPYTDPMSKYVQWSGLYLIIVAMLAVWNLVEWWRGASFVDPWLNFLASWFLPADLGLSAWERPTGTRESRLPLALICIGAISMQAINVSWGLPRNETDREFRPIHPDEKVTYEQAWRLYVDPEPVTFVWGGSAYFRFGMILKELATYFADPEFVLRLQILMLRWANVAAVGAYVCMVYACGRELFDRRTALLAGLLMAVLPGNVVAAHPARPETVFTLVCSLVLYAAIRAARSLVSTQWLLVGATAMGIAIAIKVTGVSLVAPLLTAVVLSKPTLRQLAAKSVFIASMAVVGYFLASFESFFFWHRFLEGIILTRYLHGARDWTDFAQSTASYLGPVSAFAWSVPGLVLLWVGAIVAIRRRHCLVVIAFLVTGYLLSFVQRDVTLRSVVHLSGAVALIMANLLTSGFDACRPRLWLQRLVLGAEVAIIILIAQESLGHVAYLRFGTDARTTISAWIDAHIPADRAIGVTPLYHGEWASVPPLDESRRRVVLLPLSKAYSAGDYKDRDLDYVVLSDLTLDSSDNSAEAKSFLEFVRSADTYRLVHVFKPSFEAFRSAELIGWHRHGDWQYTRPTFYLYERRVMSRATHEVP